jgi:pimeloyl-ACP methyl ester carboxylesterase
VTAPAPAPTGVTVLRHGRSDLALHGLRAGEGRPLLLLHGLGESSPAALPAPFERWPGPVLGLDFTGHGASTRPLGGGYTAEILLGDTVTALDHTGPVTIVGRGLGAYIALLAAGARPDVVRGVVLTDGPGLMGGGARPSSAYVLTEPAGDAIGPDPFALFEMASDVRPPDYAVEYLRLIESGSDLSHPVAVSAIVRPAWLTAIVTAGSERVVETSLTEALDLFSA